MPGPPILECASRGHSRESENPDWIPARASLGRNDEGSRRLSALGLLLRSFELAHHSSANMIYDLLLKEGHVIDPSQSINRIFDVGIKDGRILTLGSDLDASV